MHLAPVGLKRTPPNSRANSLGTPIMLAMFLRLRYYQSAQTREAFSWVSGQIDWVQAHPSVPPLVKNALGTARDLVRQIISNVLAPS